MTERCKEKISSSVRQFRLPRYSEIPTVGLYLEQTTKYIAEYLDPLQEGCISSSMISNYVKKHLISSPVKKQYDRDQIAYLFFIALAKNVLSLDNIARFIRLQEQTYTRQRAYDYFCDELENILYHIFGLKPLSDRIGRDSTDEKVMLRNTIIAISHKIYLEKCFQVMAEETEDTEPERD
ncbi:MAG: DUF1836 domain-containing protein [Oscillospiraceae bacterium]|nr:DUF1836 domain-containing protein [Oscillospiraceae bacterium]